MDCYALAISMFLNATVGNANTPMERREQAAYILASFASHNNTYRLMAQVSALFNGCTVLHSSHQIDGNAELPVRRHGRVLQALVNDHRIAATPADFEGHPIELVSALDPALANALGGANKFALHQALIASETAANEDFARYTRQYGYHHIFRAGLKQYYMTKAVAEKVNFFREDRRGQQYRTGAQMYCYRALDQRPTLNDIEKAVVVQAINCAPEDAQRLWNWLSANRASYRAMIACISLLDRLQCKCI
ncbi:hypothetical protein BJX99DRAFT_249531 [Aspergillus californicus]